MVEALAVASGKRGTGKTTTTLALGMALATDHDVTVVDAGTGIADRLFPAGLADVDATLCDVAAGDAPVDAATYERFGMTVVPCATPLTDFRDANADALHDAVASLAKDADVVLLDSVATLGSRGPGIGPLPVVLADRVIAVLQATIPSLSDSLKVQEYAATYDTDVAGLLVNRVRDEDALARVAEQAEAYVHGPMLGSIPESDAVQAARRVGEPVLAHAPDSEAAAGFREAAAALTIRDGSADRLAERFRHTVVPQRP